MHSMAIQYYINLEIELNHWLDILKRSGLGERRPVQDLDCMRGMLENCNLLVSAWDGPKLVGVARSMTDFHYACYLSDLAVDIEYQGRGIGRALQQQTQEQLGPQCKLILIAAPAANSYYEHIGFSNHPRCWVLERSQVIQSPALEN
ncbi:MAG: GNAT family N-acetyltransferase [Leptospiraceae bacterium]|nr:GNAT family N-acetyltransferase [Leptospiraceae bacterium]